MSALRHPVLLLLAILLSGCGSTRDVELKAKEAKALIYSAVKNEQTVVVKVQSPDAAVDVCLCPEAEHERIIGLMERNEPLTQKQELGAGTRLPPPAFLDSKTNVQEATLEGVVPAGQEYAVVLYSRGHPQDIKVKVTMSKK